MRYGSLTFALIVPVMFFATITKADDIVSDDPIQSGSTSVSGDDCNFDVLGMGKNFNDIQNKLHLNSDAVGTNNYYKNSRGEYICKSLQGAEVGLSFVKDKLIKAEIYADSDDTDLLDAAIANFGEPVRKYNQKNSSISTYANLWKTDDVVISYNFIHSADGYFRETLIFQKRGFAKEIKDISSTEEIEETK